ncbi:MAG: glycosyltransferase [Deltaproteobacteria bacterium]|nr:glycosyltransferase [Deltaproteobacteria bacterium]
MRVLQVVHGFPPREWAGTELVTLHLSQALRARGHQVTVFTRTADPTTREFSCHEEQMDGLEVVRVVNNYRKAVNLGLLYDSTFFTPPFLRLLARLRPDVVHFQHLQHLSVNLLQLTVALGYPTVLSLHDFFFPCHRIQLLNADDQLCAGPEHGERCVPCLREVATPEEVRRRFRTMEQAIRGPDVVITPSVFLAQRIRGYYPFLEEKLRVIPLGVKRVPHVARERPVGAPLRILYVGVLLPHKGAHVLIAALKGLPADAVEVSLYGTAVSARKSYATSLREEAYGLPVRFHDAYPHDQLISILSQHDVLVMPMIWEETFSLLAREAMLAGLPVIAARRGALPEVIQEGVNGLLFEPENAADLRRCLARVIAEPGLLERLRHATPPMKKEDEYAREIEELYAEVCAEPYRTRTLRRRLAEQYRADSDRQQESERLRAEIRDFHAQRAVLQEERDCLHIAKVAAEQERDRALAAVRELADTLQMREEQVRARNTRLEAIYASTTWKFYCRYIALTHSMRQVANELWRSVRVLRK